MSYDIFSDSSCDLSDDIIKENNIHQVYFYISFDDNKYMKEKIEIDTIDYYKKIINENLFPKTSMPNVQDYIDAFTPTIKAGKDVICVCISKQLSGSYQSAMAAKDILLESYPNNKIEIIESGMCTVEQGLLIMEIVRMRDADIDFEQTVQNIRRILPTGRIFFTVDNLEYLKKGGRIGNVAYFAAAAMGLKPLIIMKEGEIFSGGIARGKKKALKKIQENGLRHFKKTGEDPNDYSFIIGKGLELDEAVDLSKQVKDTFKLTYDIPVWQIGSTVCTHTGPYPLGFGFVKKYDSKI